MYARLPILHFHLMTCLLLVIFFDLIKALFFCRDCGAAGLWKDQPIRSTLVEIQGITKLPSSRLERNMDPSHSVLCRLEPMNQGCLLLINMILNQDKNTLQNQWSNNFFFFLEILALVNYVICYSKEHLWVLSVPWFIIYYCFR